MDKSVLGLLGGASALALVSGGGALAAPAPTTEASVQPAQSFAELLESHSERRKRCERRRRVEATCSTSRRSWSPLPLIIIITTTIITGAGVTTIIIIITTITSIPLGSPGRQ